MTETTTLWRVTNVGRAEIAEIIEQHSKYPAIDSAVSAYAEEVERHLENGSDAYFEIRAMHSKTGEALPFTISDDGWEAVEVPAFLITA